MCHSCIPSQVDAIEFYETQIRELESAIVAERAVCLRAAPSDSFFVFFRCNVVPLLWHPGQDVCTD